MPSRGPIELRRRILAQRDAVDAHHRTAVSQAIAARLERLAVYHSSRLPLFYVSFRSEVDTRTLIRKRLEAGRPVAVPRTDIVNRRLRPFLLRNWEADLGPGAYGIPEPIQGQAEAVPASAIDLVLVPGSVFDRRGGRYGYGGGYYDRFLCQDAPQAYRVGLAFSFQILEEIPLAPHDQRLDLIVTEKGIIYGREERHSA